MATEKNMDDPKFLRKLVVEAMQDGLMVEELAEYEGYLDKLIALALQEDLADVVDTAYNDGFNAGRDEGHANGLADGLASGYENGYSAGFEDGNDCGLQTACSQ